MNAKHDAATVKGERRGRKPLPPRRRRRHRLSLALSDEELERIEARAAAEHLPPAIWIRRLALQDDSRQGEPDGQ